MGVGRRHPLVARLRRLRRDGALRRSESVFVAEGLHLAAEALRSGAQVEAALVSPRLGQSVAGRAILRTLDERAVDWFEAADSVVDATQDARSAQPVVLIVRRRLWSAEDLLDDPQPLLGVAWALQDPGNLGSLIRTLEAAGSTGCFVCGQSADPYHPRAVRASAGSILRLPVVTETPEKLLVHFTAKGIRALATDSAHGQVYSGCDFTGACAVFFGSEGAGLPSDGPFDARVRIPINPAVESLTVTAAAAVILFEAARQRAAADAQTGSGVVLEVPDDP